MNISVVIPAYNSEKTLEKLIQNVLQYIPEKSIIIVDDGSTDKTGEIAKSFDVNYLKHVVNRGKGAALYTGYQYAINEHFDGVIFMDSDLQHDPDEIPIFINAFKKHDYDIIIGSRELNYPGDMPLIRYLTNKVTSLVVSIASTKKIHDSQSGYRFVKTTVLKNIRLFTKRYDTESEMLIQIGRMDYKFGEIPVKTIYDEEQSYINPFIDTLRFIRLIIKSWWW